MTANLMKGRFAGLVGGGSANKNKNQPICTQLNSKQQRYVTSLAIGFTFAPGNKRDLLLFTPAVGVADG
jgi:hypothetical protein